MLHAAGEQPELRVIVNRDKASDLNVTPTDDEGNPVGTIPSFVVAMAGGAVATDAVEQASADGAAEAEEDVAEATEAHDPELIAAGERAFRQCSACHQVGEGDTLTFPQGGRIRLIRVVALGTRRGPAGEAQALYIDLDGPDATRSPLE